MRHMCLRESGAIHPACNGQSDNNNNRKVGLSDINMQVSAAPHLNGEQLLAKNKRQGKQMMSWEEF